MNSVTSIEPPRWLVFASWAFLAFYGPLAVGFLIYGPLSGQVPRGLTGWAGAAVIVLGPFVHAYGLWGRSIVCAALAPIPHGGWGVMMAAAGMTREFETLLDAGTNLLLLAIAALHAALLVGMARWAYALHRSRSLARVPSEGPSAVEWSRVEGVEPTPADSEPPPGPGDGGAEHWQVTTPSEQLARRHAWLGTLRDRSRLAHIAVARGIDVVMLLGRFLAALLILGVTLSLTWVLVGVRFRYVWYAVALVLTAINLLVCIGAWKRLARLLSGRVLDLDAAALAIGFTLSMPVAAIWATAATPAGD